MVDIFFVFIWLFVCIILHIVINKLRMLLHLSRTIILFVFILGFFGNAATEMWLLNHVTTMHFTLVSIFLYSSCALAYAALTASPSLGDASPSAKIVLSLLRHGPQTETQLINLFSDPEVIGKRLKDLVDSGCLREKRGMLIVTSRGRRLAKIFLKYRQILGLSDGG